MQHKLLLVDDEVGILRALRRLFRKAGYQIFIAESAEEALELLKSNEIPVILSDFRMPGADGGVLLQKATELDSACVGMILSGFAELKQVIGAFNSGVVHRFISKPWSDSELLAQVENAFEVAYQKRIDLDLDRYQLLSAATERHSRHYPLNLVDLLTHKSDHSLVAVEFSSPRVLLHQSELNTKTALAQVFTELISAMPATTEFCYWNGYTLVLLAPQSDLTAVLNQIETCSQSWNAGAITTSALRYAVLETPNGPGADQIRELLLKLAQTDSESDAFQQSNWVGLLDESLTHTLVNALEQQAFNLVFQPICSDQDVLVAVEALMRCQVQGEVSLASLIRQIDLIGYTEQFTEIQLKLALSQFAALQLPQETKLVLNFSLRQLSSPLLQRVIQDQLEATGLSLTRLSIDVGESALKSKIPQCLSNLAWFREAGIALTLDDQGSAHAYLNNEESLRVDAVKLDRAFLHDLDTQANRQEMLVNLCDRILERGRQLSFEGVENSEQLKFVSNRYEFSYQGWALSKPLASDELLQWCADRGVL